MRKFKWSIILFLIVTGKLYSQSKTEQEDFDSFLFQFATDKEFQIARTTFPLEFVTWKNPDKVGGEIVTKRITKQEWNHDYLFANENYRPQIYDNFEGKLADTDERMFQWIGVETGIDVKYYFKRKEGKWYLIKKENLGD